MRAAKAAEAARMGRDQTPAPDPAEEATMEQRYGVQTCTIRPEKQRTFRAGKDYLMLLPTGGSCRAALDGGEYLCTATDMILLKPHIAQTLSTAGMQEPCTLLMLRVSPEVLAQYSDEGCDLEEKYAFVPYKTALVHGEIGTVLLLKNLLARLSRIGQEELALGISIYENNLLSSFLVVFLRACAQSDEVWRRRRKKDHLADDVFLFIREHLTEDLTLERLEKEFYVSGEHISRTFKKAAGIPLHAYIIRARIDLSKKYILQGCPIQEVFGKCGFGSYNHFFKAFKKECGMTPKSYYRQMSDVVHTLESRQERPAGQQDMPQAVRREQGG